MVDVRLTRQGIEVLAERDPTVGLTRQSVEVLADQADGTGQVDLVRFGIEVLVENPATAIMTRQSLEVLLDEADGTGQVDLTRQGIEVLSQVPPKATLNRQSLEILLDQADGTGAVDLVRFAIEVLFKRSVVSGAPLPLASNLELFLHNWSDELELEGAYLTDVTTSHATGAEERRALRQKPVRVMRISWLEQSREVIDRFLVNLRRLTSTRLQFPIYCDQTEITVDSGVGTSTIFVDGRFRRFSPGSRLVIVPKNASNFVPASEVAVHVIDEVFSDRITLETTLAQTYNAGRYLVFPLLDCEINLAPQVTFSTHLLGTVELSMEEVLGDSALPPVWAGNPDGFAVLEEAPILNLSNNFERDVKVTYQRAGSRFELGRGSVTDPASTRYVQVQDWDVLASTRQDAWKVVTFLDSRRGRCKPFWVFDEENLWTVLQVTSTFISIDPFGTFSDFTEGFNAVGIEMLDGTVHGRRVVNIQEVVGVWRLTTVGDPWPALDLTQIRRVTRLRLSRLQEDSTTERWTTVEVCRFSFTTREILDEGEQTL